MATSGNFLTNSMGNSGNYFSRMLFEWWQTSSGISGSVGYHNISYHIKTYGGSSGYYQQANGSMNVDGAGYSFGRQTFYGNGATVFGDYSKTLYTDSNGNRSFSSSAQFAIYSTSTNSSGSGSWGLDNIPLHAVLTGLSMDAGGITLTDEGDAWVEFANPSGTAVSAFIDSPIGRAVTVSNVSSRYNFVFDTTLQANLQQGSPNSNSYLVNIGVLDSLGGNTAYDFRQRTGYIANDHGQANPVFSNFTFLDNNSSTVAITGNNQYLIQGQSFLNVTVPTANAAIPQKYASMDHYTVNIGGYSNNLNYSSNSDVTQNVGIVNDVIGTQNLSVTAVDSRGNSNLVTKPINILPYSIPIINATATRANGYDDALILNVSGQVSPITIGSTDKNIISSLTGIQYRAIADGGDITTLPWISVPNTQTSSTGAVNINSAVTIASEGDISANHPYQVQVRIIDAFYTTVQTINVAAGVPIFRIGLDGKVYNKEDQLLVIPSVSVLADSLVASAVSGTGTIVPWTLNSLYVTHGTGVGNSATVVFDVNFSFWISTSPGNRTWALKVDGNVIGNPARSFQVDNTSIHIQLGSTIVAKGLSAGTHIVTIELYGGGDDIRTDEADFLTVVSTEYANAYVTSSSGPNYAGTVVDGGGNGNVWTSPDLAEGVEDGNVAYAYEGPGGGGYANQLVSSNHGFSIPTGAVINGIVLEALVFGYDGASDAAIEIGRPGKMSNNTPNFGQSWYGSGSLNWLTWGSSSSLWGRNDWTAADINNSGFGASLSAYATHSTSSDTIDAIRITVYYI